MTFVTGPETPQRLLLQEEVRSPVQSGSPPQMTSMVQAAIFNHEADRYPLLQGRAASSPVQPSVAPEVLLGIDKVLRLSFLQNDLTHQREPAIALEAVTQNDLALDSTRERLKDEAAIVLEAVTRDRHAFKYASEKLKDDRSIVLEAVTRNGHALKYASEKLKDDGSIVLAAVTKTGQALEYASERLKGDCVFLLEAVTKTGQALEHASERLKKDRAIVLVAVTQNGLALQHASVGLKDDPAIVLAAVTQNGLALQHASVGLKDDPAIVLAAVTQNGNALGSASQRLKGDRAIVLAAVTQDGYALNYATAGLRADRTIFLPAITQNGLALEHIPVVLRTIEITCAAVAQNQNAMWMVPNAFIKRANGEIDTNPTFLPLVDPSLITYNIGLEAVKLNPLLLGFVPPRILEERPIDGTEDDDIILLALKQNPEALHLIPWELLTGAMLSFVIEMHKRDNKRNLSVSLVKLARIMGAKAPLEIKNPHLDLAWPLLEFFKDSREIMLILINKYGLEASDAGPQIILDPDITAADRKVLAASTGSAWPFSLFHLLSKRFG